MSKQPYFSVIIALYNRKHLVERAIQSVLDQTFKDWELIIVDDGSTDGSYELVQGFSSEKVRVFRNETNQERCITRNRGVPEARGKYICFLDSDDYHLPEHFEKLHSFILSESEPKALFFTNAWNSNSEGQQSPRACPDFEGHDPYTYFLRYTVNPQRWAIHHEVMQKHLFDPEVNICEDMDTSLRMVADGVPVFQLKERTTVYVAAEDSFTHGATDKWERELANLKRIFLRPELNRKLPKKETNRLLSMCHYHLAVKAFNQEKRGEYFRHALKSFSLFPQGYNRKTNLPLTVMGIYSIPVVGYLIQSLVRNEP